MFNSIICFSCLLGQTSLCADFHASTQRRRPSNPHHIQIWRFWKRAQKSRRSGPQNWRLQKYASNENNNNNRLFKCFRVFFTLLVLFVLPWACCTVTVSWHPKPWVSRSNREGWKAWRRDIGSATKLDSNSLASCSGDLKSPDYELLYSSLAICFLPSVFFFLKVTLVKCSEHSPAGHVRVDYREFSVP